jgi:type VI secretion system protein ImpC
MGGTPWSLFVGMYTFEQNHEDIETLGRMAKIAALAGAPFVTEASYSCLGCSSLEKTTDLSSWRDKPDAGIVEAWSQLRNLPESQYLGLALFRLLLRLPYGEDTDPIDMFDLEEFPSDAGHDGYLWGNPAVGIAYLLGHSFLRFEWQMRGNLEQDIQNLPMHIYKEDDETYIKPCSEVILTDRAVEAIIDTGFMPMLSFINQDRVRLGRFQSLNKNSIALAGRW